MEQIKEKFDDTIRHLLSRMEKGGDTVNVSAISQAVLNLVRAKEILYVITDHEKFSDDCVFDK